MHKNVRCWFFDTVVLSNFALAERLDLLVTRYGARLAITNEVLDEISDGVAAGHDGLAPIQTLAADGVVKATVLNPDERKLYVKLLRALGPGEASCIAAAVTRHALVATDDRAARACCAEHKVQVTGTIGILKACCRDCALTADRADAILAAMVAHGFYSPVRRISDVL
jgi:predicted nucleic acid-binding protein